MAGPLLHFISCIRSANMKLRQKYYFMQAIFP